jgi:hypothetical protein
VGSARRTKCARAISFDGFFCYFDEATTFGGVMSAHTQEHETTLAWRRLIESSAFEVTTFLESTESGAELDRALHSYAQAMQATFLRQPSAFADLHRTSRTTGQLYLQRLCRLRSLYVRFKTSPPSDRLTGHLRKWVRLALNSRGGNDFFNNLVVAEAAFLVGDVLHDAEDFVTAEAFTQSAVASYRVIGCAKKALRSELNLKVTQAHLNPNKSWLFDFFLILKKAKAVQDPVTMSSCYHSISHEYGCLGATRNALRAIDRALTISYKNHYSSKIGDYLAHKIDLLVHLDEKFEAQVCFELLSTIESAVAQKAQVYLLGKYPFLSSEQMQSLSDQLPARYWEDKLQITEDLGALEERLLSLLASSRKTKYELAVSLYGEALPLQSTEARLKNILYRIRKKYPSLIHFKNAQYSLDPSYGGAVFS